MSPTSKLHYNDRKCLIKYHISTFAVEPLDACISRGLSEGFLVITARICLCRIRAVCHLCDTYAVMCCRMVHFPTLWICDNHKVLFVLLLLSLYVNTMAVCVATGVMTTVDIWPWEVLGNTRSQRENYFHKIKSAWCYATFTCHPC